MNNNDLSFTQALDHSLSVSPQERQSIQPSKSSLLGDQQGQMLDFSAANVGFPSMMPSDTSQYSLSTLFGNDMGGLQDFQRCNPNTSAMAIQMQQQQLQQHQQQQQQQLSQHPHQQQLYQQQFSTEFVRSIFQPKFDHLGLQRTLGSPNESQLQTSGSSMFPDATAPFFMTHGNNGMVNMAQLNPHPNAFVLPSPHELTLRDQNRRMRGGVIEPFPEKLHRLLIEVESAGRSDVISFIACGKAFAIHKPDKFFNEIVPLYFRQSRLSSFKRQLNLYGFELINTGPTRGGYFHEMFVKDHPELCRRMRRVAIKFQANKSQHESMADIFAIPHAEDNPIVRGQVVPRAG